MQMSKDMYEAGERTLVRARAVRERWRDAVALAMGGYGVGILVLRSIDCGVLSRFGLIEFSAITLVAIAVGWRWFRLRLSTLLGVRYLHSYPPIWVPALLGAVTSIGHGLVRSEKLLSQSCRLEAVGFFDVVCYLGGAGVRFCAVGLILWVVWVGGSYSLELARLGRPISYRERDGVEQNQSELFDWLASDEAIRSVREDLFGHASLARRLSEVILSDSEPTVALVGNVGAGKTSVFNMVSELVSRYGRPQQVVHIARISLWPFDSVQAAISGVLSAISEQIANKISVFPLRGLPGDYIDVIEGAGVPWTKVSRLARPEQPSEVLRRIDYVALAANIKVVLWIEDFERFAGLVRSASEPEYVRLAPIRALLNELSELKSVQIVLASSAADYRFDIEKLARFVVNLPPVDASVVELNLRRLRIALSARFPNDLDPVSRAERDRLWPSETVGGRFAWALIGENDGMSLARAMSALCATPRQLKQALRYFGDAWSRLHGEIDFDDLLMISIVRVSSPALHDAINRHIGVLRSGVGFRDAREKKKSQFSVEAAALLESMGLEKSAALRFVVGELFPGWEGGDASFAVSLNRPQAIASRHTDYWRRYISLETPADVVSDQRMLRLIERWIRTGDAELVRMLASGVYPKSLEALLRGAAEDFQFLRLLEQLVEIYLAQGVPALREEASAPPGLASLWSVMREKRPDEGELIQVLNAQIERALPINITVAFSLVNLFATLSNQVPLLVGEAHVKDIASRFQRLLMTYFVGKPDKLAMALRGARSHTLYWGSWGLDRIRANAAHGLPSEYWKGFSVAMLEGALLHPKDLLPQVLPFVTKRREMMRRSGENGQMEQFGKYIFDKGSAELLFDVGFLVRVVCDTQGVPLPEPISDVMRKAALEGIKANHLIPNVTSSAKKKKKRR